MSITVKTIKFSRHALAKKRLYSGLARYPRWIHAEGRTHRVLRIGESMDVELRTPSLMEDPFLARNAASSRAIPVGKMLEDVISDPAIPLFWGRNQAGMQGGEELTGAELIRAKDAWFYGMDCAVNTAKILMKAGAHKQIVNRVLEPYSHITVLFSGTEWGNFFALRIHEAAEPHIRVLAELIKHEQDTVEPDVLHPGQWHLPFVEKEDYDAIFQVHKDEPDHVFWEHVIEDMKLLSTARSASTSYKTVDGFDMTIERAKQLKDKLLGGVPLHASPAEHVAEAASLYNGKWDHPELSGPFIGFNQYRKMLPNENIQGEWDGKGF